MFVYLNKLLHIFFFFLTKYIETKDASRQQSDEYLFLVLMAAETCDACTWSDGFIRGSFLLMIDLLCIISELLVYSLATVLGSVLCLLHFKSLNTVKEGFCFIVISHAVSY